MSLYNIPRVCIVSKNSSQTTVPVKQFTQPISQHMQSPLYLGLPQLWWKDSFRQKSGTRSEWWMCWCPRWIFKSLHPKIVSPFLNAILRMKTMHGHKTQTVIWSISDVPGGQRGSGSHCKVSESTCRGRGWECSVVLGAMKRVNVTNKVMPYTTLFSSDCGCCPYFMDLHVPWILSEFRGYIRIFWILSVFCGYYFYWSHYELLRS